MKIIANLTFFAFAQIQKIAERLTVREAVFVEKGNVQAEEVSAVYLKGYPHFYKACPATIKNSE